MRRALRWHGKVDQGTAGRVTGRGRRGRKLVRWGAPAIAAVAVAGCATATAQVGRTPVAGGVATYALPPVTVPTYIFPFISPAYFSIVNTDNLQYLMYRPLYWYGEGAEPFLNKQLSLAKPATYHGNVVTIQLKHFMWSNDTPVSAADVVFWLNMMKAEKDNWGGYVPGGMPDNVTSYRAVSPTEVQLVLNTSTFSHTWFAYNELSQITPMPLRWDVTASGKSDCATQESACPAVYQYLNSKATAPTGSPATWPGSPLWSVVDGPWKLTGYNSQGVFTYQFNTAYSGPVAKYHITTFKEVPFTSEEAEYNVLQAQGSNTLDVGYLPTVDASVPEPGQEVGQNPVSGYQLQALYTWGLSFFPYNYDPADPLAPVFKQLYFRTAFQDLMNQEEIIQGPLHGYGKLTTSVVGDFPRTKYLSKTARAGDPFPYNPVEASHLLVEHGWVLPTPTQPNKVAYCAHAALCGSGVATGTTLNITVDYANGLAWLEAELLQLKANAAQLGMHLSLVPMTFQDVINRTVGDCGASGKDPCPWELDDWGSPGWSYSPDFLPTGDEIFETHSVANLGHYNNAKNDRLIAATLKSSQLSLMWTWEDYLTRHLPVVLQPDAPYQLVESINNLQIGVQNPTLSITPEQWYYVR